MPGMFTFTNAKIKIRRDTAANWTANNPTLELGEAGYETDTFRLKVGNGTDDWVTLGYISAAVSITSGDIVTALGFTPANAASVSGTNTGDQTITLTGNVTGSGTGSFATTIANSSVSLAKMADMATSSLIYRKTAGAGAPEVNTLATLKTDLGLTGTNSGDQTITLTGNVTGSGAGSFATTIANGVVTLGMLANMATGSLFYRKTAGSGAPEVQTLATLKTDLGLTGTNSGDQTITLTGDVTGSGTGSFATAIGSNKVLDGMIRQSAGLSIIGRAANTTGNVTDITGAANGVLRVSGTTLAFGAVDVSTAMITGDLPFANLVQAGSAGFIGATGAGDYGHRTVAQVTAALGVFTDVLQGVVPASGGGTTNFLRADGTWVAPPAGGGGSGSITASGYTTTTGTILYRKTAATGAIEEQTLATLKTDLGLTGTNSGDQTITLTGDVTGSGTGSFATTIGTNKVVDGMIRQSAAISVIGRSANSTGNVADIAGANNQVLRVNGSSVLAFGAVDLATAMVTGDLPFANLAQGAALSVLGVTGNAGADVASIAAGTDGHVLRRSGTTLGFGTVPSTSITGLATVATSGSASDLSTGTLPVARLATNQRVRSITFVIDGGGATITTGVKGFLEIPFGCTIDGWTILGDQSGSIVVDVWKDTYANYPPTVADTIAGSEKPTITTATKGQDLSLSTWTTGITAGDVLGFNVDSVTTLQKVTLSIRVTET